MNHVELKPQELKNYSDRNLQVSAGRGRGVWAEAEIFFILKITFIPVLYSSGQKGCYICPGQTVPVEKPGLKAVRNRDK